jgi:hypothetical protein
MSDERRRDGDRPDREKDTKGGDGKALLKGMLYKNFCPFIYVQYQPRGRGKEKK